MNIELRNATSGSWKGAVGTVVVHIILLAMLILVGFSNPPAPDTEEGILVNFGTGETGMGDIEPSPPALKTESAPLPNNEVKPPSSTAKETRKSKENQLLTQDKEEAPVVKKVDKVVKKVDPDAEKKRIEKIEADKKINEQLEAEKIRIREEEAEKKRIAAEQQRESDIMNRTKNALADSKNRGTGSTSEGIAGGTGNQGDPNGSINSKVRGSGSGLGDKGNGTGSGSGGKEISYNLGGRGIQSLPEPIYKIQVGGRVVVEVSVDRDGKVIQANPGIKGSTTLDEQLLKISKDAALKARFQVKADAPAVQKGTITYNFILK